LVAAHLLIGLSDKPTRSYKGLLFRFGEAGQLLDIAMALGNELPNFNIVVEKLDSSKIGCKRGCPKGREAWATKGYTVPGKGGHIQHPGRCSINVASSI
jgi:hypothetical protein